MASQFKWVVDQDHPAGHAVPCTAAEESLLTADQAAAASADAVAAARVANASLIRSELQAQITNALTLADAIDAGSPTPAQQRQALSMCLHGLVRLAKVVYSDYAQPA